MKSFSSLATLLLVAFTLGASALPTPAEAEIQIRGDVTGRMQPAADWKRDVAGRGLVGHREQVAGRMQPAADWKRDGVAVRMQPAADWKRSENGGTLTGPGWYSKGGETLTGPPRKRSESN